MLNSAIIEVIIGLIFVFSLASIIVTQINTVITSTLNTRARHLKAGLEDLITDPVVRLKLMAHPLIRLIPPQVQPSDVISAQTAEQATVESQPKRINWIPAELFSQALLDILSANAAIDLYAPLERVIETSLSGSEKAQMREMLRQLQGSGIGVVEFRNAIGKLADPRDRGAMVNALSRVEQMRQDLQANNEKSRLIPLLEGIRYIEDTTFRKAMETLLASARSLEEAEAKIEFWFNARMDQLSELYRRRLGILSLLVGMLLTVTFNIDSLYLARSLWDDPALRAAIAATAQQSIDSGRLQQQLQQSQEALQFAPDTQGTFDANAQAADPRAEAIGDTFNQVRTVSDSLFSLLNLRLPVGWDYIEIAAGCPQTDLIPDPCTETRNLWNLLPGNNPDWMGILVAKILGWLVTIVAISQGAPFWFDLLNRIARGRSTQIY
ncbi:hypothetical protein FBR02_02220 [Anaerolineae bacterium CFX9]|nr:hypothetical protein [Anaerolineae bacterium CFX9]